MKLPEVVRQAALRILQNRQRAYLDTFDNPVGHKVLRDLAKFCRAHESTFHPDPRVHATLEGRREVWLRIASHMKLDDERLWQMYGKADK